MIQALAFLANPAFWNGVGQASTAAATVASVSSGSKSSGGFLSQLFGGGDNKQANMQNDLASHTDRIASEIKNLGQYYSPFFDAATLSSVENQLYSYMNTNLQGNPYYYERDVPVVKSRYAKNPEGKYLLEDAYNSGQPIIASNSEIISFMDKAVDAKNASVAPATEEPAAGIDANSMASYFQNLLSGIDQPAGQSNTMTYVAIGIAAAGLVIILSRR